MTVTASRDFPIPARHLHFWGKMLRWPCRPRAARGRPPSAWLITGAPGVGKATLAYRIARYLLAYGATEAGLKT